MSNLQERDIGSEDLKITDLVRMLQQDKYLIPTFQREFVWEPEAICKLWDSMYRFYPIGSLLYWETDTYLHTHRKLGGLTFPHDEDAVRRFKEWKYILDGQQRATSLLVSMAGGTGLVKNNEPFDYTLYFDATTAEFLFADKCDERKASLSDPRFLVRLRDVPEWGFTFYKDIHTADGFDESVERNLLQLQRMYTDYKLSVIRIKGVDVNEVCEIFERINQEGKKLDPVDIMVARTYRNPDVNTGYEGFYLRDRLRALIDVLVNAGSRWQDVDQLLLIQMFAMCLRKEHQDGRNPFGITPAALDNLNTKHFEERWDDARKTILETIKFLSDQKIIGPSMLPFVYLALPICYYFHQNRRVDRDLARQWFWRNAFGLDSFGNSTEVYRFSEEFFDRSEAGEDVPIPALTLSKARLVETSYYYRNALCRAVLAFLANQRPIDFSDPHAEVLDAVYLLLSQAPNLHHFYPRNFLNENANLPSSVSADSLMNICYLRAKTNIQISDKNPLEYIEKYRGVRDFDEILRSHLLPQQFLDRIPFRTHDFCEFLYARAGVIADKIRQSLPSVTVQIVDSERTF